MFSQIVIAAPDIDAVEFLKLSPSITNAAGMVTLYSSSRDVALKFSRVLHGFRGHRAGEFVKDWPRPGGIDTIDASEVRTDLFTTFNHSYFSGATILADVFSLIRYDLPPFARFGLFPKPDNKGSPLYWIVPAMKP